jgi:segregation and condensation protein A
VPTVSVEHMYQPQANVKDQAAIIVAQLRRLRRTTFRTLTADCAGTFEIVARFLALLELYRELAVSFEQIEALGELHVTWTGSEEGDVVVGDGYRGAPEQGALEPNGDEDSD